MANMNSKPVLAVSLFAGCLIFHLIFLFSHSPAILVMGGFTQPQGQVQVVLNMLRYLQNPQHSLDLPRLTIAPPPATETIDSSQDTGAYSFTDVSHSVVYLEDGITNKAIQDLEAMGHTCIRLEGHARAMMGRGQIIRAKTDKRTGKRVLVAGSDPRGDGHAQGW
jgi:gamma-glutamyltranspeptidase/glutathione hydrolase